MKQLKTFCKSLITNTKIITPTCNKVKSFQVGFIMEMPSSIKQDLILKVLKRVFQMIMSKVMIISNLPYSRSGVSKTISCKMTQCLPKIGFIKNTR